MSDFISCTILYRVLVSHFIDGPFRPVHGIMDGPFHGIPPPVLTGLAAGASRDWRCRRRSLAERGAHPVDDTLHLLWRVHVPVTVLKSGTGGEGQ